MNIAGGGKITFNTDYLVTAPTAYAYAKVAATTAKSIREGLHGFLILPFGKINWYEDAIGFNRFC